MSVMDAGAADDGIGAGTWLEEWGEARGVWAGAVTLVTVADGRDDIGATVSAFCPVSAEPPLVLVSLMSGSYPAELFSRPDEPVTRRVGRVNVAGCGNRHHRVLMFHAGALGETPPEWSTRKIESSSSCSTR